MHAFLAFTPILVVFILLVLMRWPAKHAMPVAWLYTGLMGIFAWQMDVTRVWPPPCRASLSPRRFCTSSLAPS
jgi:L-lactate permease